jgi:hypothetical protein
MIHEDHGFFYHKYLLKTSNYFGMIIPMRILVA